MQPLLAGLSAFALLTTLILLRPRSHHRCEGRLSRLGGSSSVWGLRQISRLFYTALVVLASVTVASFLRWNHFIGPVIVVALLFPFVRTALRKRITGIGDDQVELLCASLANSLRAGLSLAQALERGGERVDLVLRQHLRLALQRHHAGLDLQQSLQQVAAELSNPALIYLVEILLIHQEAGGELPVLLAMTASTIRERRMAQQELMSRTVEARLSASILALLPIGVTVLLILWQPASLEPLVRTAPGRAGLSAGVGCWIAGVLIIRWLLQGISRDGVSY